MTGGNPALTPIYASVITAVEILPAQLDLGSFAVQFYPGKIMLDPKDPGARPKVVDYQDGPATFRCEMVRIAIGESDGERAVFPPAFETIFRLLQQGAKPPVLPTEQELQQIEVDAFAQEAAALAEEVLDKDRANALAQRIFDRAKNFVRLRARRAAAGI